jgi:hypothetical protein
MEKLRVVQLTKELPFFYGMPILVFITVLTPYHIPSILILILSSLVGGPGSSVGIATGYGLDGPGIECRWGRDFSHTSRAALGPTQPPVQ